MHAFLSLQDTRNDELRDALARLGPIILPSTTPSPLSDIPTTAHYILADGRPSIDTVTDWLNAGAEKVILPLASAKECIGTIPKERIVLLLDLAAVSAVSDSVRSGISAIMLRTTQFPNADILSSIKQFFDGFDTYLLLSSSTPPTPTLIRDLSKKSIMTIIPTSQLTLGSSSESQVNVADLFLAPLVSDRADGLFPTIVSAYNHAGKSLGLVYSSSESVKESILTGRGVYQSRKHGLWRKGETSGATQTVMSIRADCDSDALEFSVVQAGTGFCHTGTTSCFGEGTLTGLAKLETTLVSRKETALEGSYTQRLFNDRALLAAKIREEAQELIDAETKEEIAFEAADLVFFALTRCIAEGVSLVDIERALDKKALKVTRRAGNAKPQFVSPPTASSSSTAAPPPAVASAPIVNPSDPIRMRSSQLDRTTPEERAGLLRRPVLNSSEMIAKVQPIVSLVRERGDNALIELTAKFDKAQLDPSTIVIRPPYTAESMEIPDDVKEAIDVAYSNLRAFHAAQAEKEPLRVETMPGVICSRFARPIARVGLYVPGGTAILPSTALHLGVPAQVAGCGEIVIATPPRADGSISPEVMYVAKLVGASAILKAGGAQAVAAMAYGTESCPKVDKIFGPGNQWVTAAKMLVQNDTDALVAIDMPAGPSEVLVISDDTGHPAYIAADLLSQAEHGVDSQVVLVGVNLTETHLAEIEKEIDAQARALPRVDIVRQSIAKSIIVSTRSLDEALKFSNDYAPEHLILHLKDAPSLVQRIENAGSVFVGPYTPESCGDYASGTNHTLPTNGYARQFSGVNTLSFQKHITSQEISREGLDKLGPYVVTLAECEGLSAHANAVRVRLARV